MSLAQEIVQASRQETSPSACALGGSLEGVPGPGAGRLAWPCSLEGEGEDGAPLPPDELELCCVLDGRSEAEPSASNLRLRCFVTNSGHLRGQGGPRPVTLGRAAGGGGRSPPAVPPPSSPRPPPSRGTVSEMYRAAESIWEAELSALSPLDDRCPEAGSALDASPSDLGGLVSAFAESPPASPPPPSRLTALCRARYPPAGAGTDCDCRISLPLPAGPGPVCGPALDPGPLCGSRTSLGPSHGSQPSLGPSHGSQPSLGPSHGSQPSPGPMCDPVSVPRPLCGSQPSPGPSHGSQPSPGPSHGSQPSPGPSHASQPSLGPDQSLAPARGSQPSLGPSQVSLPAHAPARGSQPSLGPSQVSLPAHAPARGSQPSLGPSLGSQLARRPPSNPQASPQGSASPASASSLPSGWESMGSRHTGVTSNHSNMTAWSLPAERRAQLVEDPRLTHSAGTSYSPSLELSRHNLSSVVVEARTIDSFPLGPRRRPLFDNSLESQGSLAHPRPLPHPQGLLDPMRSPPQGLDPFRNDESLGATYVEYLYPRQDKAG
ncbi:hypothetical protein chiPu_0025411 [Chiloscyllium punctatum]|uniref:Uncharacterized protein n=1 Tax=Chiloscyllium punctatum TaxID=137246 RepID=A0A401TF14_CHIPU|nr:hypothetical protein [Chiloscyllium punctatum]